MTNGNDPINAADPSIHSFSGMTKREYFAAMAFQAMLSNTNLTISINTIAKLAVQDADKLIEALNNHQ